MKKILLTCAIAGALFGCATKPPVNYYPYEYVNVKKVSDHWVGDIKASEEYTEKNDKRFACVGVVYSIDKDGNVVKPAVFSSAGYNIKVSGWTLAKDVLNRLSETKYQPVPEKSKPLSTHAVITYFGDIKAKRQYDDLWDECAGNIPNPPIKHVIIR